MDVRDLEVFLAVAKNLNFSRAGEEIHLSQPSVSVRISRLEDELQARLFEKIGKRIVLTEAGRILEPYARRVVTSLTDSRRAIEEYRGLEQGSLKIGASTTPGMYVVPKVIARFKRRHPKIAVSLSIKNTRQVEEDILKNEFDLGFVGGHLISDEIETVPWRTDELVLVLPCGHPLTRKKQVRPGELAKQIFINREQGSATRAVVERHARLLNLCFDSALELGNPEAVKQVIKDGLGIAFLSRFAVEAELTTKSLAALKVQGLDLNRELRIIFRKGQHLNRAASAFIEMAQRLR